MEKYGADNPLKHVLFWRKLVFKMDFKKVITLINKQTERNPDISTIEKILIRKDGDFLFWLILLTIIFQLTPIAFHLNLYGKMRKRVFFKNLAHAAFYLQEFSKRIYAFGLYVGGIHVVFPL